MLEEGNIRLRKFMGSDKSRLAVLANNIKIWKNVRDLLPHPYHKSDAEAFISSVKDENPQLTFAIEYSGEFCGAIGLSPQSDVYRKTAEIGYWIGEPFWGKGIASTAVKLLTQYGFEKLKLVRIYTGVFEYNIASMRVLEKNGYTKDAIFRKSIYKEGKIIDEHRYSITI